MILNILFTLILVGLNGFFVAAEFAIVKVRASQIEILAQNGHRLARISKHIVVHLNEYLSATQLGITLASLGLGWIGESVVSDIILHIFQATGLHVEPELAHKIALPIAFSTITFLHIVLGELAPKSIAILHSEATTLALSVPLRIFYVIFKPFIILLNSVADATLRLIGLSPIHHSEVHSEEELRLLLEQSHESGEIASNQHQIIENVFHATDRTVRQIMVPRTRIVALDEKSSIDAVLDKISLEGFSRIPVYKDSVDNIIGVIYAKDLLTLLQHKELIMLSDIIRPVFFVSENTSVMSLLRILQYRKQQLCIATDEFGGTSGLVTMEDIIEELVGEIQDEYDDERPFVEQHTEREFRVPASTTIIDANEVLPIPLPEGQGYDTISGLVNKIFGKIPEANESIDFEGYRITVCERTSRAVVLVEFSILDSIEYAKVEDVKEEKL